METPWRNHIALFSRSSPGDCPPPTRSNPSPLLPAAVAALATLAAAGTAAAQRGTWSVVNLHPAGASDSQAWSIHDGIQAGEANFGGRRAGIWMGSAASFQNLHPPFASFSFLLSTFGGQHVGAALVDGFSQASLWTGNSPASWMSLHPAGADFSVGMGGGAGQQVGRARFGVGTPISGILWTGSAASFVNLHPGGAVSETWALSAHSGQQVGSAAIGGFGRSSLWMGSAGSWIDLTPPGALASRVEHTHNGRQVGMVVETDFVHASLWNSTPESRVNLNPAGTNDSWLFGNYEGVQVGYAAFGGQRRAGYWSGTAASFVNLHDVLPPGVFTSSEARAVWIDAAGATYVVGWARVTSPPPAHNEAIMWVLPGPDKPCPADFNGDGDVNSQDFFDFLNAFFAGAPEADFNGDGEINSQDFFDFLNAFFTGCP